MPRPTNKTRTRAADNARRLGEIADALADIPDDGNIVAEVIDVIRRMQVTYTEFAALDGRDNYPGVPAWHWKLRVTRNANIRPSLFDVMAGRA